MSSLLWIILAIFHVSLLVTVCVFGFGLPESPFDIVFVADWIVCGYVYLCYAGCVYAYMWLCLLVGLFAG